MIQNYVPNVNDIVHLTKTDLRSRIVSNPIFLMQYSRDIDIIAVELYNNSKAVTNLLDYTTIAIRMKKKDGTFIYNTAVGWKDNTVYFKATSQMTMVPGEYDTTVELENQNGIASTTYIKIKIDRNPVQQDDVQSEDEYTEINAAKYAAEAAAQAARNAQLAAEEAETNALASEMASKDSEDNAKVSENNAKTSELNAKLSEDNAKSSEDASSTSENNAETYMNSAAASANNASTSETNALTYKQQAEVSKNAAKSSETASKTSETAARSSELNAKDSETASKASETASKTSELNAKDSETASKTSELNAKDSETNALTYKQNAEASKTAAEAAATNAQLSADLATARANEIHGLLSSDITSDNKAVSKSYVDNQIAENSATYRGKFDSVELLNTYSGPVTNNDTATVEVKDEESHIQYYERYKYSAAESKWKFELRINNTNFTAKQWDVIDNGVTKDELMQLIEDDITGPLTDTYTSEGN